MQTHSSHPIRVLCSRISEQLEQSVTVQGWVHAIRNLGRLAFVHVRDRSGIVQCVLEGELAEMTLSLESVVSVTGLAVEASKAPGGLEIRASAIQCISAAAAPLPFEINKKTIGARLDTMLDNRVLSLRHPKVHATFHIQAALAGAFRDYLTERDFTQIFTPKIVASGTEGGSNLFPVDYFGRPAYLAQSPQFYKQMMVGAGYERVFEIAPVYRAEEHNTSRHLNEYVSLDVEMGFIRSEEELMDLEQDMLGYMLRKAGAECEAEFALLGVELPVPHDIPRIPVAEAQSILQRKYGKTSPKGDLDPEGERLICRYAAEQNKPAFVFITRYPREIRPMYAMPAPEDAALTASFDLIFNGLEITTGGQRIHDYDELTASIRGRGLLPEHFESYLDLFRYGMPPHGGFAIGLERLTSRLLGQPNVREASAFPRDRMRLTP
ncbi:aspartate--tRNA(Asn) ligase [Paenibacillus hemerocallicola]|uniref:Aspartate--tRNA(Asp/Asn) ligase n=1 Tax=Paenibacillus hemerocallicola TaxID=1172614 RepID=A0A5C4TDS3_9BACL|nr:aspartate--tRNA(Asn) ligase [Paenibacillus hemerocallicola]TNJ66667.1 aspartate--tRNA(Asn) ligase [Paenibacillus hemerocallicola]